MSDDDFGARLNLINIHRRNLRHLMSQVAHYGSLAQSPQATVSGILSEKQQIQQIKQGIYDDYGYRVPALDTDFFTEEELRILDD